MSLLNFLTFKDFVATLIEESSGPLLINGPDENQSNIKPKIKRIPNYRCHICERVFWKYGNVLSHIACIHYKKKLQERFGENAKKCGYCAKDFEKQSTLFCHLATSHNILESKIPAKDLLMIKKNSKSKSRQNSNTSTVVSAKSSPNVNLQVRNLSSSLDQSVCDK